MLKKSTTKKLMLKNFLFVVILIENLNNISKFKFSLQRTPLKKKKFNKINLLRAPNRYKKAQVSLVKRYYFLEFEYIFNFSSKLNRLDFLKFYYLLSLGKHYKFFESNFCILYKTYLKYKFNTPIEL